MDEEKKSRAVMEVRPERKRGRLILPTQPRLQWEEYVAKLAARREKNTNETKRLAQNKTEYRKWLRDPDA